MGAKGKDVRLDGLYLGTGSWCVSTLMHLDDWLYECFWGGELCFIYPGCTSDLG